MRIWFTDQDTNELVDVDYSQCVFKTKYNYIDNSNIVTLYAIVQNRSYTIKTYKSTDKVQDVLKRINKFYNDNICILNLDCSK